MKKYFLFRIIFTVLFIVLVSYSAYSRENKDYAKEDLNLEDSIIIRGIEMESDTPQEDEDNSDGMVIYDDEFDDTIIDYDKLKKQPTATRRQEGRYEKLKIKDNRWHLSDYKIRKNDNLWRIARKFGIDFRLIIEVNNIKNPNMLSPGKTIKVPNKNGFYYSVKKGDTVLNLSRKFKVESEKITAHNNLKPDLIKIGQKIFIPDTEKPCIDNSIKRNKNVFYAKKRGIDLRWPIRGRITSTFGTRKDPFTGRNKFHCGIDVSARVGTPIRAAAPGRVIFSGWKNGYGRVVIIRHRNGYITVYAHNSKNSVRVGEFVNAGNVLALSGKSGAATGGHLHFEIRKYVNPLNPMRFLN